jgi:hypothetical protein
VKYHLHASGINDERIAFHTDIGGGNIEAQAFQTKKKGKNNTLNDYLRWILSASKNRTPSFIFDSLYERRWHQKKKSLKIITFLSFQISQDIRVMAIRGMPYLTYVMIGRETQYRAIHMAIHPL